MVVQQLAPEIARGAAKRPVGRDRVLQKMISGVHYDVAKVTQTRNYDCVYACLKMLLDFHGIPIPLHSSLEAFHGGQDVRFGVEHLIPVGEELGLAIIQLHDNCDEYQASDLQRLLESWGPVAAALVFGGKNHSTTKQPRNHMVVIDGIHDVYVSTVDPVPDNESPMQGIGFATLLAEVEYFVVPIPRDRMDLLEKWSGKLGRLKCASATSMTHGLGW